MINSEINYDQEGIISILKSIESPEESTTPQPLGFDYSIRGNIYYMVPNKANFFSAISWDNSIANDLMIKDSNGDESIINNYLNTVDGPIRQYFDEINLHFNKGENDKHDLIKRIISFESLKKNWDGYGAYPLEVESASNAIKFINLIDYAALAKLNDVFPNPNGTVSFLWENSSNGKLSLEIGNDTFSYYLILSSQQPLFFDYLEINSQQVKKVSEFVGNL